MNNHVATYQSRLAVSAETEAILDAYANLYGSVERKLYAEMRRDGEPAAAFKNEYLVRFGITARQFNAIARNLEGKIDSVRELLPLRLQETELAIAKAEKVITKSRQPNKIHQKKRRLAALQERRAKLLAQQDSGDPRICFGSRQLFRKQFNLEINGYRDHQEWRQDWQTKRNSQFFVLGSKDETGGCQGCTMTANLDGTFNLQLRLPNSLGHIGKHVALENIRIGYGADTIRQALRTGQAISYRFLRDAKGWRVLVSTSLPEFKRISVKASGAIGVDINADCLAVSEIDRFGNLVGTRIIPLVTYGKDGNQAKAAIGEAIKDLVAQAVTTRKPLIIEKLDFKKKRAELEAENPRQARMLSSLSYNKIIQQFHSAAYRAGIEVLEVNSAYSSLIGLVNFSKDKGLSVHQAAALVLARRGGGFRERPATGSGSATVPTPKGDHVTFPLPARNRGKHVWSFWRNVHNIHRAVLAAHLRPSVKEDPSRLRPSKCNRPRFTVEPRDANRRQHCSAGVMENIPW